jgi:hypothetical protein
MVGLGALLQARQNVFGYVVDDKRCHVATLAGERRGKMVANRYRCRPSPPSPRAALQTTAGPGGRLRGRALFRLRLARGLPAHLPAQRDRAAMAFLLAPESDLVMLLFAAVMA